PELWSLEDLWWIERSRLGPAMRAVARGGDPHTWVIEDGAGIEPSDVTRFWEELVPALREADVEGWSDLAEKVSWLRARWERDALDRLERVARRYRLWFVARVGPRLEGAGLGPILRRRPDPLGLRNHAHIAATADYLMTRGRERFDAALADESVLAAEVAAISPRSGLYFEALWSPERLRHHVLKSQQLEAQLDVGGRPAPSREGTIATWGSAVVRRLWGGFDRLDLLRELDPAQLEVSDARTDTH